jgi:hypothetical protein
MVYSRGTFVRSERVGLTELSGRLIWAGKPEKVNKEGSGFNLLSCREAARGEERHWT